MSNTLYIVPPAFNNLKMAWVAGLGHALAFRDRAAERGLHRAQVVALRVRDRVPEPLVRDEIDVGSLMRSFEVQVAPTGASLMRVPDASSMRMEPLSST